MRPSPVTLLKMVTNLPLLLISLPALALPVPFVAWFASIVLKTIIQFVHQISPPTGIYATEGQRVICFVWLYSQSAEPWLAHCKFYLSVLWINGSWKKKKKTLHDLASPTSSASFLLHTFMTYRLCISLSCTFGTLYYSLFICLDF